MKFKRFMVKIRETSCRKGVNSKPVDPKWIAERKKMATIVGRARKIKKTRKVLKRKRKFVARPSQKSPLSQENRGKKNSHKWERSLTAVDILQTTAVRKAQKKLHDGCLQPPGRKLLLKTLSESEKKRRPSKLDDKCIAMPHGTHGMDTLAAWVPCLFVTAYYPNQADYFFYIMKRTEFAQLKDARLSKYFVVLSTDAFLVPPSFSVDFDMHFASNTGIYVIKSSNNDVYVGWSGDIKKRIHFHNTGQGATFTSGKRKWFRICPIVTQAMANKEKSQSNKKYSQEAHETKLQKELRGPAKVRGACHTKK